MNESPLKQTYTRMGFCISQQVNRGNVTFLVIKLSTALIFSTAVVSREVEIVTSTGWFTVKCGTNKVPHRMSPNDFYHPPAPC